MSIKFKSLNLNFVMIYLVACRIKPFILYVILQSGFVFSVGDIMTSIFNLELSEHHVCGLIDLFRVHGEADLRWVLCDEGLAILSQLLKSLALTLGALASFAIRACSLLNKGLKAELDCNSHQVRVLCHIRISLHNISQLKFLFLGEQNTPSIFYPNDLALGLLVYFDEGTAQDEQLILECVSQIAGFLALMSQNSVRRVK